VGSVGARSAVLTGEPAGGKRNLRGKGRRRSTGVGLIGRWEILSRVGDLVFLATIAAPPAAPTPISPKLPSNPPHLGLRIRIVCRYTHCFEPHAATRKHLPTSPTAAETTLESYSPRKRCSSSVDNRTCFSINCKRDRGQRARRRSWYAGRVPKPRESRRARSPVRLEPGCTPPAQLGC
jgi:hypothetical protein